ncbi:hypothetical protein SCP_0601540 [Sparassis crispa]|uniref:Uncharacterized protein n=1 Tax=Sparassis crispa TaxID=139825 RepID=A0A401GPN4_9APHY|nr:hypothetical protein SCP_0601540 [Sparassis crispa]GBE84176.1 hypothetical protein SCP_0601540 [Sparassis crispa]
MISPGSSRGGSSEKQVLASRYSEGPRSRALIPHRHRRYSGGFEATLGPRADPPRRSRRRQSAAAQVYDAHPKLQ